jgi:hypothetical protein
LIAAGAAGPVLAGVPDWIMDAPMAFTSMFVAGLIVWRKRFRQRTLPAALG